MTAMTREEAIAALVAESKQRNAGIIPWPESWTWEEQRDATVEIVVERLVEHLTAHPDVARVLDLGADREREALDYADVLHAEHHPGVFVPSLDSCPEHDRAEYERLAERLMAEPKAGERA